MEQCSLANRQHISMGMLCHDIHTHVQWKQPTIPIFGLTVKNHSTRQSAVQLLMGVQNINNGGTYNCGTAIS